MEKNAENLHILRHSASHIMAQAVQKLFPETKLAIGPAIDNGFYYDFDSEHSFTEEDLTKIENEMKAILKQNLVFEKYEIPDVQRQIDEFKAQGEIYKAELLEEHRNENPTLYLTKDKDGNVLFNDLCAGPHVPNTSYIKGNAIKLMKVAGAYWRGNEKNKMLQRIYATAFWNKEDLAEYLTMLEEAQKRDHRKLGTQLDLFSVREEIGGGLVLWHPNLYTVREEIENYWRTEHRKRGYVIVQTPQIAKSKLWEISGHIDHYKDNMFFIQKENEDDDQYIVKPMNCPFHILIYQANRYSYRSLPLRMAELGITDFYNFDFIASPGREGIIGAVDTLNMLGALDSDNTLSEIGKLMVKFPLEPRISRIIVEAIMRYPDVTDKALVAASFFLSAVLSQTRANESRQRYETSASAVLGDIAESWQIRRDYADNITRIYHDGSQALLDDVSLLIERNRAFLMDDNSAERQQLLDQMRTDAGCDLLFAFDDAGKILFDSASDAIDAKEIYDSGITEGLKEGTGGKFYGTEPVISRNTDADSSHQLTQRQHTVSTNT